MSAATPILDTSFEGLSLVRRGKVRDVYAVDDNLVALAATTTNDVKVGRVVGFVSATEVRVKI